MDARRRREERAEQTEYTPPEHIIRRRVRAGETLDVVCDDLVRTALENRNLYHVVPDVIKSQADAGNVFIKPLQELEEFQTDAYAVHRLLRTSGEIPFLDPAGTLLREDHPSKTIITMSIQRRYGMSLHVQYYPLTQRLNIEERNRARQTRRAFGTICRILNATTRFLRPEYTRFILPFNYSPEEILRKVYTYEEQQKK